MDSIIGIARWLEMWNKLRWVSFDLTKHANFYNNVISTTLFVLYRSTCLSKMNTYFINQ